MKEWYLMSQNTRPNSLGGYENQGFIDFKDDAFSEALETEIADTVTVYNYDLTESITVRCIIQGRTADTHLKSLERHFLFQIGTAKAGMYVYYEGVYWLLTGYNGNNGIYEKLTGTLCVYKLRWQNSVGDVIERWITATSAAKYDVGEDANYTLILTSNNMTIEMPIDEESMELDEKRVFIDIKEHNPTKVYKITRNDDVPYHYGDTHFGILSFIASKTEIDMTRDNQELRICDYFEPETPSPVKPEPSEPDKSNILCNINGRTTITIGSSRTYIVTFTDTEGKDIPYTDIEYQWNIKADFGDLIERQITDNTLTLRVDNNELAYETFALQVIANNIVVGEVQIIIEDIY